MSSHAELVVMFRRSERKGNDKKYPMQFYAFIFYAKTEYICPDRNSGSMYGLYDGFAAGIN